MPKALTPRLLNELMEQLLPTSPDDADIDQQKAAEMTAEAIESGGGFVERQFFDAALELQKQRRRDTDPETGAIVATRMTPTALDRLGLPGRRQGFRMKAPGT